MPDNKSTRRCKVEAQCMCTMAAGASDPREVKRSVCTDMHATRLNEMQFASRCPSIPYGTQQVPGCVSCFAIVEQRLPSNGTTTSWF
jgi:hypothetical protein